MMVADEGFDLRVRSLVLDAERVGSVRAGERHPNPEIQHACLAAFEGTGLLTLMLVMLVNLPGPRGASLSYILTTRFQLQDLAAILAMQSR